MTSEHICDNCGATIPKGRDSCRNCSPKKRKTDPVSVVLVIAVLCSSLLLLSSSVVNVATLPAAKTATVEPVVGAADKPAPVDDMSVAAYEAAQGFILETYPGPKRFSELRQSAVEQNGNVFTVTLSADELGGASPVRYFFAVEMELSNNIWRLKEIKR